jgi:hypothetical protein
MNIEIIKHGQIINLDNVFVKSYTEELSKKMDVFSKTDIDFSSIGQLKGDKRILNMSFIQLKEELNK